MDFILVQIILQIKFISCTEDNDCRLFTNRMRLEHMSPVSLRRKREFRTLREFEYKKCPIIRMCLTIGDTSWKSTLY